MIATLAVIVAVFAVAQARIIVLIRRCIPGGIPGLRPEAARADDPGLPRVVVQLPVYRDHAVLGRLLAATTALDYPPGRLAVQVLDDSEEEEGELTRRVVNAAACGPVPVAYIHRGSREGYKSGALNHGLGLVDCDLVAIFDADFAPDRSFLLKTVPLLADQRVAAAHTRWHHRNDGTALTLMQAAILDSLFCFESAIRQASGASTMYLGTCGVWSKRAIEKLGGWREAPFTDDGIDLSFRAAIGGWSVVYLDEPLASADLPSTYIAYKSQQRRWAQAALRLFLDYGSTALRPPQGESRRFLELTSLHLVLSTPMLLLGGLLTAAYVALGLPRTDGWIAVEVGLTLTLVVFPPAQECVLSQRLLYSDWRRRCRQLPAALPFAIGVSLAILAGFRDALRRRGREFVRTPKACSSGVLVGSERRWLRSAARIAALELAVGGLLAAAAALAAARGYLESLVVLILLGSCYLLAGVRSCVEIRRAGGRAVPDC